MAAAPTTELPNLIPFAAVAKTYGLSLRSMREAANRADFDHVRFGHNLYFRPQQLDAFIELKTRKGARSRSATRDRVTRERKRRIAA